MFIPRILSASCFLLLCLLSTVIAQVEQPANAGQSGGQKARQTNTVVTASATAERVRFTAPSNVVRMQLQVISENGQTLFDVSSKGNVLDWSLQDSTGQRLQGSYLTVVTVKTLSGRLSERIGSVSVADMQVELRPADATGLTATQQQAVGPIEENGALTILKAGEAESSTVLANNGSDGQIIRDRGALSFRLGNFFSGKDMEQMRLTEEGNLGIGTDSPQAKLDVAGMIRTTKGIEFENGTKLTTTGTGILQQTLADGTVVPNAGGTGTQDKVAKWTDSAGTLGDSSLSDVSGLVGLGTTSPITNLQVNQPIGAGTSKGLFLSGDEFFQTGNGVTNAGVMLLLGVNRPGNRQLWIGDRSSLGSSTNGFFRIQSGVYNSMDAVTGNGTTRLPLNLGTDTTNVAVGFNDFIAGGPGSKLSVAGNMVVGTGFKLNPAPADGLLVQGNVGIGNTAPGAKLDVTGAINSTQYNILGSRVLSVPGINNAFVGVGAANLNTTGQQNSFFGANAGSLNTTGNRNSLFGSQAGVVTTNGANSFFGYKAGFQNSTGGFNSFFGDSAGTQNVDGNNNTAIGYSTKLGSSNLTNATAVGALAQVDANNSLILGSIAGVNGSTVSTNVGIGITAPSATLHVVAYTNSSGENTATFQAPNIGSNQSHIHYGTTGDWYLRSAASAGKVVLQDSGGNVGIGTGSPVAKLDVRDGTGASGSGGHVHIGANSPNADEKIIGFGDLSCGGLPCVYLGEQDSDDRMVLYAFRDFRFKIGNVLPDLDNSLTLGSVTNRWKTVFAVDGMIQTSDVRLKQEIANLKYGLSQVMRLRPVSFQWKSGNDKGTHLGLIAQEVDAVLPEAVEKNADAAAPLGMNYSTLIPVLIKAIQEQQGMLERAQAELKKLRAENDVLSRRIVAIEETSTVATATKQAH